MPTRVNLDLLSLTPRLSLHWHHTSTIEGSKPRKPKLCQELIKYTLLKQHTSDGASLIFCHMLGKRVRVDWLCCHTLKTLNLSCFQLDYTLAKTCPPLAYNIHTDIIDTVSASRFPICLMQCFNFPAAFYRWLFERCQTGNSLPTSLQVYDGPAVKPSRHTC